MNSLPEKLILTEGTRGNPLGAEESPNFFKTINRSQIQIISVLLPDNILKKHNEVHSPTILSYFSQSEYQIPEALKQFVRDPKDIFLSTGLDFADQEIFRDEE